MGMRIGVDLGGTKIEAIAIDVDGTERARRRVSTPRGSYAELLSAIVGLVAHLEGEVGESCTVGIGMPGVISPASGLVKNSNTTTLNGKALDSDLEQRLNRPLKFENDANCFALSEAVDGAGAGRACVFGVIIGTGTGGGIVIDQRIVRGRNAVAGEWGHNPLPWLDHVRDPSALCYCGKRGCVETYLSGSGLVNTFRHLGGDDVSAAVLAQRAVDGDPMAEQTIALYSDRLARSLASVINIVDPDVIVLGGGLSNIEALYCTVPEALGAYVFSDSVETPIVPAMHGDSSGVRGAAWLWSPR